MVSPAVIHRACAGERFSAIFFAILGITSPSMATSDPIIPKVDSEILEVNSTFRILSSFMYGYSQNEVEVKNGMAMIDLVDKLGKSAKKAVEVDANSFIDLKKSKSTSKSALYISLFKFGDRPIKAKIVTYESEKSREILKDIE